MSIKVMAIGNRLMGDDGVAIYVAENLKEKLKGKGIEVIIGETDFEYCISKVDDGDFLLILDATYFGRKLGTVTINPIELVYNNEQGNFGYSQHGCSIIKMLGIYNMRATGFIIGIEGEKFEFSLSLSKSLEKGFEKLCLEVYKIICYYIDK